MRFYLSLYGINQKCPNPDQTNFTVQIEKGQKWYHVAKLNKLKLYYKCCKRT